MRTHKESQRWRLLYNIYLKYCFKIQIKWFRVSTFRTGSVCISSVNSLVCFFRESLFLSTLLRWKWRWVKVMNDVCWHSCPCILVMNKCSSLKLSATVAGVTAVCLCQSKFVHRPLMRLQSQWTYLWHADRTLPLTAWPLTLCWT